MILAQLSPDMLKGMPVLLLGLGALIWLCNEALRLVDRFKGKAPHPPNSQLQQSVDALTRQIARIELDVAEVKKELKQDRDNAEQHVSARSSSIYQKIDQVTESLRREMVDQSDRRDEQINELRRDMNTRFDSLPEKIMNFIRNMGGSGA